MTMKSYAVSLLFLSVVVIAAEQATSARDKHARLDSRWLDSPVTVDGSALDWPGPLVPFNDEPVSIGAANDGESMFVVLTASERAARMQIVRRGLIVVRFRRKDRKKRRSEAPIGAGSAKGFRGRRHGGGGGDVPSGAGDRAGVPREGTQRDGAPPQDAPPDPPNRLEVLGSSKDDARSFTADKAPGIEVKLGQAEGLLTYELKVPLAANDAHPYGIGAKPGAVISVGLEMPKLEMPEGRGREGGGRGGPGGGMGGHGGGGMGGYGGMGGRGGHSNGGGVERAEQPKPLSGWMAVQLASK
jgi:hypothetical protein